MSVFRTRRIKTKYAKIRKKNLQLLRNKTLALKKQNWIVSNDVSDVFVSTRNVSYDSLVSGGFVVSRQAKSSFLLNSASYYDLTNKFVFLLTEARAGRGFVELVDLETKALVPVACLVSGFLFYGTNLRTLYIALRSFFVRLTDEFTFTFTLLSKQSLRCSTQLLAQDGFLVIVSPFQIGCARSVPLSDLCEMFFLLAGEGGLALHAFDATKLVSLGVLFEGCFYSLESVLAKFAFVRFFCDYFHLTRVQPEVSGGLAQIYTEVKQIPERRDDLLFLEAPSQEIALRLQAHNQTKANISASASSLRLLSNLIREPTVELPADHSSFSVDFFATKLVPSFFDCFRFERDFFERLFF